MPADRLQNRRSTSFEGSIPEVVAKSESLSGSGGEFTIKLKIETFPQFETRFAIFPGSNLPVTYFAGQHFWKQEVDVTLRRHKLYNFSLQLTYI